MAITWTVIVFGALLHGMKCNSTPSTSPDSAGSQNSSSTTSLESSLTTTQGLTTSAGSPDSTTPITKDSGGSRDTTTPSSLNPTASTTLQSTGSRDTTQPTTLKSTGPPDTTQPTTLKSTGSRDTTQPTTLKSTGPPDTTQPTTLKSTGPRDTTQPTTLKSTGPPDTTQPTTLKSTGSPDATRHTSVDPNNSSSKLAAKGTPPQQNANDSSSLTEQNTEQNTTQNPTKTQPITTATLTASNHSPQNSVNQVTTMSSILVTTTHNENGKTPLNQIHSSAVTTNSAPYSKPTESIRTREAQTTPAPITSAIQSGPRPIGPATSTSTPWKIDYPPFNLSSSSEGNVVLETCKKLAQTLKGNCLVSLNIENNELVATIRINADENIQTSSYKPPEPREEVHESSIPDTLVAILASSGALVLILCCFAAYCTYHRRSYRKNQQHLTEELQTVENGYHDNPTLEVMEVVPEMQEKKLALNGEFNDSWIVPIDNLLKEDIPDEEDTHL